MCIAAAFCENCLARPQKCMCEVKDVTRSNNYAMIKKKKAITTTASSEI